MKQKAWGGVLLMYVIMAKERPQSLGPGCLGPYPQESPLLLTAADVCLLESEDNGSTQLSDYSENEVS